MILIDSSVWIDWFADRDTLQTRFLEETLTAGQQVGVGDLMLVEVLQGFRHERDYRRARDTLLMFDVIQIADGRVADSAALNYRRLRTRGMTIRKTIDTLIATRCILDDFPLLYSDRDFDPFVRHLGLRSALCEAGVN